MGPCPARGGRRLRGSRRVADHRKSSPSAPGHAAPATCISSTACTTPSEPARRCWRSQHRSPRPRSVAATSRRPIRRTCSASAASTASSSPTRSQLPYVLENAIRAAVGQRGVAVVVMPGTSHCSRAGAGHVAEAPVCCRRHHRAPRRGGAGSAGFAPERRANGSPCSAVAAAPVPVTSCYSLAEALKSPIVHALGGKEMSSTTTPTMSA